MASSHSRSGSSAPSYRSNQQRGLSDDYITISPDGFEKQGAGQAYGKRTQRGAGEYLPPPFPPPGREQDMKPRTFWQRYRRPLSVSRYLIVLLVVGSGLAVPVVKFREDADGSDWDDDEGGNTYYYVFLFLLTGWISGACANLFANAFPHVFKFAAKFINPGHRKYWRIFRFLRLPITILGFSIGTCLGWNFLIIHNPRLIVQKDRKAKDFGIDNLVADLLSIGVVWSSIYMLEKIVILFISIHYHYRTDGVQIQKHKRMRAALTKLYETSIFLFPAFHDPFQLEDAAIRDFVGSGADSRAGAGKFLAKIGAAGSKIISGAGKLINSDEKSRWFKTASNQTIVDHALEHPRSSAALAKRIWMSFVPEGHDILTAHDLNEVLGQEHRAEAEEWFQTIDENKNGDLTLNEMVLTVIETGRAQTAVYRGMTDINRAINTLDWILITLITMTVTIFMLTAYVPALKGLKDAAGLAALGLTFGIGRAVYEFLSGCLFIFFKHAYDVGDRIEVYNTPATIRTAVIVERISILFTVFKRLDNGKDLQMSNDRLNTLNIENVSRSGVNREELSIFVDFNTTFTDIQNLKGELNYFLSLRENSRDYKPGCELRVAAIHEMNKLELKVGFTHKSNWANEELRLARSSKFMCALVVAIRRVPIARPGALIPGADLKEIKDKEFEAGKEEAAYRNLTVISVAAGVKDAKDNVASGAEINSWVGQASTGMRRRPDQVAGGMPYGPQ